MPRDGPVRQQCRFEPRAEARGIARRRGRIECLPHGRQAADRCASFRTTQAAVRAADARDAGRAAARMRRCIYPLRPAVRSSELRDATRVAGIPHQVREVADAFERGPEVGDVVAVQRAQRIVGREPGEHGLIYVEAEGVTGAPPLDQHQLLVRGFIPALAWQLPRVRSAGSRRTSWPQGVRRRWSPATAATGRSIASAQQQ